MMRDEIVNLSRLGRFTWCECAHYFPNSPSLPMLRPTEIELTFNEMADRWLGAVRPAVAATTWDEYKNTLNNYWRPCFGDQWIRAITYENLVLEIAELPALAAKTFNNAMTPLRGIWAMALKMRKLDTNITLDIGSRKPQKPVPDPLELDEVTRILEQLRDDAHENWWNYFTLAFFYRNASLRIHRAAVEPMRLSPRTNPDR
jgi:integrase